MRIYQKQFNELTINELYDLLRLRAKVFVVEQQAAYQDLDDKDQESIHLFIKNDEDLIVSYVRVLPRGLSYETDASIGRVVTDPDYRKNKYTKALISQGIQIILNEFKTRTIRISAQTYLIDYYSSFGFKVVSEEYLEDGLPHKEMLLE
ncbi:predicted acetyltransferase [Paracholeplasma brassicae]|uniref:Predicted acetyltransferase n=1 Tax=Acholeplasma brassicae TaxID=61635 RepID=U4KNQ6_9MOLU|nr:GNAT family N-acetyltransferase [Paracholeplasma brassicae]CCV65920.1 predicted acetyltransferase [Paracholeplasma brassicae]